MSKVKEFNDVYLELPDEYEIEKEDKDKDKEKEQTIKLSLDELQKKLEETQSLHL